MAKKNTAEVLINGKIYTISGYESTEYLQKVANYLNKMEDKISGMQNYDRLSADEKQLLKNMNLADEYFKADEAKHRLEQEAEHKDKELYGLKHDLIDAKMEKEQLLKKIEELEAQILEEQKKFLAEQKRQNRLTQMSIKRKLIRPEHRL